MQIYAEKSSNIQQICAEIIKYAVKIFEKWPDYSQRFTSDNNSNIFLQIHLINQNFRKYFAKNIKIL